jgi:hypothetical protein
MHNTSTQKAETGRLPVRVQPGLHSKTLYQKKQRKEKEKRKKITSLT